MEFDENKAVSFINKALADNGLQPYPADEILNIIDMIWDYYEENGLLEIDDDDDDDVPTVDEIQEYVTRMLRKDKGAQVSLDDLPVIINAELDYEESLDEA